MPVEGVWAPLTEAREGWFHDVLVNDDPDDWGVFPENHDGVHGVPVLVVPAVAATNTEETIQDQLRLEAMYDGHTHAAGNAVDRIDALETALHRVAMTEFTYTKPASMAWAECCKIAREALEAS